MTTARYRDALPQLAGDQVFLTDSGLETDLIFNHGIDLPAFASFPLVDTTPGPLQAYFAEHVAVAAAAGLGVVLETPTWRASPDWAAPLGYGPAAVREVNRRAVDLVTGVRDDVGAGVPVVVSGNVGPRADGYRPTSRMAADEARRYHATQVEALAGSGADLVSALTMTYPAEAIGVAQAATDADVPCVLSFTVETDGRLPDGDPDELGRDLAALREAHPQVTVLGGCCGTDVRHVARIAAACSG